MADTSYPQVRIVPARFLNPDTVEDLANRILALGGIRRIVFNGPRLPEIVPYGPARGTPNVIAFRREIEVMGETIKLQVHVGTILLELEDASTIPEIRSACEAAFRELPHTLQEGKFMRSSMTMTDYAKYGVVEDERILGMVDPKSKTRPIILQGNK
ncbi:MAG: methyl-coenzyme M reductase operon protein D [Methanocalculus sp. MSAO_Arc1]|uniref:methyl-coenzyme M reductase operon protein D n=1 Tax=Methanocalculus TaxID=71151 RepID=UPI000FF60797|nr:MULTISPECIES: methyl-coenzyme M reductase operon protein D [unclassified Methanocalculus]MCP1663020.1 methyl-coenzyme M reductase subunit D [Methanocalculus sp. AMF5]RQD79906.1 MAG: methyl-coenzyme M reductase operon protein D [Methanocalculus sp. MSAO_Arc1]